MKKMKPYPYLAPALAWLVALVMASCNADDAWQQQGSGFLITLSDDVAVETRSTPQEIGAPVAEEFHLYIVNDKTGETLYNGSYTSDYISAPPSDYTLEATFGSNPELAYDAPYYYGTATATVLQAQPTAVEIPCTVANCLLSVEFTNPELFDALYITYGVTVSVGHSSLDLTPDTGDKSAYFQDGATVTLTFFATVTDADDKAVSMEIESEYLPETYEAGKHYKLSLTSNEQTSGAILTVEKVEVETVSVEETIPLSWLPKPTVSDAYSITYVETEDAPEASVIALNAGSPLQDLQITIDAQDPQYTDLNGTYLLSEMTTEQLEAFAEAGISLPTIDGSTKTDNLDLSAWVATLQTDAGETTANNVTVNVKANNRWSTESDELDADGNKQPGDGTTYTITVVRPDFTVSVQDYNIWSKEFTADEIEANTGDKEKLESDLVYQYSEDGGATWTDFNDNDEMRQYFEEHPEQKEYLVRALYRGAVASSNTADVELEDPTPLPNGEMDYWSDITVSGTHGQPCYAPWNEDEGIAQWWDTNNYMTVQSFTTNTYADYKCFPTTCYAYTYTDDAGDKSYTFNDGDNITGKAAVIRSIKAHTGNTNYIDLYGTCHKGFLYIGETDSEGNMTEGRTFESRPTSLTFQYIYTSYSNENFGAYIELYNGDTQIASGSYVPTDGASNTSFAQQTIELSYSNEQLKATSIRIRFSSVSENVDDPVNYERTDVYLPDGKSYTVRHGSELIVDDITLIYDK